MNVLNSHHTAASLHMFARIITTITHSAAWVTASRPAPESSPCQISFSIFVCHNFHRTLSRRLASSVLSRCMAAYKDLTWRSCDTPLREIAIPRQPAYSNLYPKPASHAAPCPAPAQPPYLGQTTAWRMMFCPSRTIAR